MTDNGGTEGVGVLELTRRPEMIRCLRCRGWMAHRRGFGAEQRWCTRFCWMRSRQRRETAVRRPGLFQSGPCAGCGAQFTTLMGGGPQQAQSSGGRWCSERCHRAYKRQRYRVNRDARVCPGCRSRPPCGGRGGLGKLGILCHLCRSHVVYGCLSKQRLDEQPRDRKGNRAYACLLCGGWHRSSRSRVHGRHDEVLERLAPLYAALALDPAEKAALVYQWRLRRGAQGADCVALTANPALQGAGPGTQSSIP